MDKLPSEVKAVESRVQIDGKCVTSRGPGTTMEYSVVLVEQLYGKEKADEVAGPMVGIILQHLYVHSLRYPLQKFLYSLRSILLFANTDVSTTKMCLDTSILAKSIMGRREYQKYSRVHAAF
jgi:hypothetical protein